MQAACGIATGDQSFQNHEPACHSGALQYDRTHFN
jgi:hypothetical protein